MQDTAWLGNAISLTTPVSGPTNVTSGLVLWWKLDEGSGLSTSDSATGTNGGTLLTGAAPPIWTNGIMSNAVYFVAGSFSSVWTPFTNYCGTEGTVTWWMYQFSAYNASVDRGFFGDGIVGPNLSPLRAEIYSDNNWYVGWDHPSDNRVVVATSSANSPQNTWAHYAFTWSDKSLLYMNAVPIGTNAAAPSRMVPAGFCIGTYSGTNDSTARANAIMDDVRIYNRCLSSIEITNLYQWRP